ncbi:MAG: hypothetical protein ACRC1K_12740 [Planctomycetia bacterium]
MQARLLNDQEGPGGVVPAGTILDDPLVPLLIDDGRAEPVDDEARGYAEKLAERRRLAADKKNVAIRKALVG